MNFRNIFDYSLRFLLIFLPWSTVFSVFLVYKLWIPGANFIKEIFLFLLIFSLFFLFVQDFRKNKKFPIKFSWLAVLIFAYILVMSVVTIFTTGLKWLIFGGRYDFIFLIIFLITFYGYSYLQKPIFYYLKIFLISAGLMLFVSWLLKYPFSEELLLFLGYSHNASVWDFGGAPPIFHWIDGAGVRRFQWLLDGPNTMWAFLIIFSGIFFFTYKKFKDWYFVMWLIFLVIVMMLIYTYSRSAIIGMIGGFVIALSGGFVYLFRNYKKQIIALIWLIIFGVWIIGLKYDWHSESIIGREGSTKWHLERMIVGFERFSSHPFGQGLGSSGPAYRHVLGLHDTDRQVVEEQDRFYIPESWYIQQFIEWWFIGWILFLVILAIMFFSLYSINSILAGMFAGIGAMNLVLHTFESSVVSWLLFIFVGLFLAYGQKLRSRKK